MCQYSCSMLFIFYFRGSLLLDTGYKLDESIHPTKPMSFRHGFRRIQRWVIPEQKNGQVVTPFLTPLFLERMSWVGVVKSEAFDSGLFSNEYFIESIHRRACTHTVFCNRALSGKNVYQGWKRKGYHLKLSLSASMATLDDLLRLFTHLTLSMMSSNKGEGAPQYRPSATTKLFNVTE